MRYLREYTGPSKEAHAYEDQVSYVEATERLVTVVSVRPGMRVVSQFTRREMAMIIEDVRVVDEMRSRGLLVDGRRRWGFIKRFLARFV